MRLTADNLRLDLTRYARSRYDSLRDSVSDLAELERRLSAKLDRESGARICRDVWSSFVDPSLQVDAQAEASPVRRLLDYVCDTLDSSPEIVEMRQQARGSTWSALAATSVAVEMIERLTLPEPPADRARGSERVELSQDQSGLRLTVSRDGETVTVSRTQAGQTIETAQTSATEADAQAFLQRVVSQALSRGCIQQSAEASTAGERYQQALSEAVDSLTADSMTAASLGAMTRSRLRDRIEAGQRRQRLVEIACGRGDSDELLDSLQQADASLVDELLGSTELSRFVEQLGRYLDRLRSADLPERVAGVLSVDGVGPTRRVADLVPAELALLASRVGRRYALTRLVSGLSSGYHRSEDGSRDSGALSIALDTSGSMRHQDWPAPAAYAGAVALLAHDEGRAVELCAFSGSARPLEASLDSPAERIAWLRSLMSLRPSGGTRFEPVVEWAATRPDWSDLLVISDGDGSIDEARARDVLQTRRLAYLVIGDGQRGNPLLAELATPERYVHASILSPQAATLAAASARG